MGVLLTVPVLISFANLLVDVIVQLQLDRVVLALTHSNTAQFRMAL